MGLRVGIVTGNAVPEVGGGWTFSTMLTGALKTAQGPHAFIALDGMNDKNINNWPEAVAPREHIDIVWFLKPDAEPLSIPYIATVWDLEHRKQPYFPEVSSTGWTWSARENVYNALLPRASLIITGTQAGKEEVMQYYRVNPANVMVIPFPAPSDALMVQSLESEAIKEKYGLDGDFLFYPAQFWSHKNHVNLLRGLRLLRDQYGLDLDLVLTGSDQGNRDHVMREVVELGLSDRVFVLGFIPREDLIALYRVATALVFPSYFGPDNFPPLEAFALGCPVIAADVPGAREQLGEGALLFDPSDPSDIAAKIDSLCRKPGLRAQMISKGDEIAKSRTVHAYIATLSSFLDRFEAIRRCWGWKTGPGLVNVALEDGWAVINPTEPAAFEVGTSVFLRSEGMHAVEEFQGRPLRWTDGFASIFVPLIGHPPPKSLSVKLWNIDQSPSPVTIWVNGSPIFNGSLPADGLRVTLQLPPIDGTGKVVIEIHSPSFRVPGDSRALGVAVESLLLLR